jgi:hypothetical protein
VAREVRVVCARGIGYDYRCCWLERWGLLMARIVAVHGIGQQLKGPHTLKETWLPAMRDGLTLAGAAVPAAEDLACAFYGNMFRRPGTKGVGEPPYRAGDLKEGFERELLEAWWEEAAATEHQVPGPDAKTKLRTPDSAQRALNALSRSRFFAGLAERAPDRVHQAGTPLLW